MDEIFDRCGDEIFDEVGVDFGITFFMKLGSIFGSTWAWNFLPLGFTFSIQLRRQNLITLRSGFCFQLTPTWGRHEVEVETPPLRSTVRKAVGFVFLLDDQLPSTTTSSRHQVGAKI